MSEEPKSFWRKPWRGWRGLLVWFVVMTVAIAIVFFCIGLAVHIRDGMGQIAAFALRYAAGLALTTCLLVAFIRWVCCWRNFRRFLFGFACFITLIGLFYAEEDWRGWHEWNQFKRQWEAKGEKFDYASIIPPAVPDDQNFAFSPVWIAEERYLFQKELKRAEAWYGNRIYNREVTRILPFLPVSASGLVGTNRLYHSYSTPELSGDWAAARLTDLKPWQSYYRNLGETSPRAEIPITPQPQSPAQDVLLALSKFDPVIEQVRADSMRPYSRFPVGYDDEDKSAILLPHLAEIKRYARVLHLRAVAELRNGQNDRAFDDVKLTLYLVNSIRKEPFIISQLVRFAIFQIALQPVYEGLAEHQWSDAQLAELDSELSEFDFLANYKLSVRGERAAHIKVIDYLERKRSRFHEFFSLFGGENNRWQNSMNKRLFFAAAYLCPKGWFYQNDLMMAQMIQQLDLPIVNDDQQTVSPRKAALADESMTSLNQLTPFNFLLHVLTPTLGPFARKAAYGQNAVDLARVAIALERYRLAHGEYPESLDGLVPQFISKLPHDIIGGRPSHGSGPASQPLHYRRTPDGQFVLYSIGWNETDDGGVVVLYQGSSDRVDITQGDWVWRYPAR